ncbi:hypothetical protein U9M73_05890 [Paenibacillus phoenicis]|uniref:Uncharacterized protein n=1 Tax=Paenibacillus phoenicis TaxID=554117 RepID=A0ABU5PI11_9BACL|nr:MULTISPECIES: hypothetical protein [Paenibacillus]MCT2194035.1 hypothetical protein [Paenibacillus sp. p3-SID1389]MEA3569528.1 hypothetical protein [Paenibacillus phoenicis]
MMRNRRPYNKLLASSQIKIKRSDLGDLGGPQTIPNAPDTPATRAAMSEFIRKSKSGEIAFDLPEWILKEREKRNQSFEKIKL